MSHFEILRLIYGLKIICVFVSSNRGPLTVSFKPYPWNPLVLGCREAPVTKLRRVTQPD